MPALEVLAGPLRIVLGFVFLFSGLLKVDDLGGFADIATQYALVPAQLSRVVRAAAVALPFTEIAAGALLLVGVSTVPALVYVAVSLAGYIVLEGYELYRQHELPNCGCYGTAIQVELSWTQVAKNVALLSMAVIVLAAQV